MENLDPLFDLLKGNGADHLPHLIYLLLPALHGNLPVPRRLQQEKIVEKEEERAVEEGKVRPRVHQFMNQFQELLGFSPDDQARDPHHDRGIHHGQSGTGVLDGDLSVFGDEHQLVKDHLRVPEAPRGLPGHQHQGLFIRGEPLLLHDFPEMFHHQVKRNPPKIISLAPREDCRGDLVGLRRG